MPGVPAAGIGDRAGGSGLSGYCAEHILVQMIEHCHLWERVATGNRQLQAVRVEVQLYVAHASMFVPAMRALPFGQVEPLL